METVKMVGIAMIVLSVLLLAGSFTAYAKHRLTEDFGMIWGVLALGILAAGITLTVAGNSLVAAAVVAALLGGVLVAGLFGLSQVISVLIMKNQELAMQVSLLNQENEAILRELTAKKEKDTYE